MCVTGAVDMSDNSDEEKLKAQAAQYNTYFKALIDLVPPSSYFSVEVKNELLGNVDSDDDDEDEDGDATPWKRKKTHIKKRGVNNPLCSMSISQITELRLKGQTLVPSSNAKHSKKESGRDESANGQGNSYADEIEAKHQGKKKSRNAKALKNKGKELQRREVRLEELHQRLKVKLEEMKARKNSGKAVTTQEQKRLRRQEKKMASRLKTTAGKGIKNKEHKERRINLAEGLRSPPRNTILNDNGDPVKSKFDFSMFSVGNDKSKSSNLQGRDYKNLLEKVEKRKEQVQELKQKDLEKGRQLEEKMAWQTTLSRAKGEKIKDDPQLLKKSLKRKEKIKSAKKNKWGDRVKKVDDLKDKRQQKRQANLDKRKSDKNDKKKKKLVKKGRVIPGF